MTTAQLALQQIVNGPLHLRQRWGAMLGKFDTAKWTPIVISGLTLVVLLTQIGFGANGVFHDQAKDVQTVQSQVASQQKQLDGMSIQLNSMQSQMALLSSVPDLVRRLNDRLDAAPRADMIESRWSEIQRHLSALDGRGDATETRMRADEDRMIRDDARLDAVEKSTGATLGNRR
jgi:hypothetical protein